MKVWIEQRLATSSTPNSTHSEVTNYCVTGRREVAGYKRKLKGLSPEINIVSEVDRLLQNAKHKATPYHIYPLSVRLAQHIAYLLCQLPIP